MSSTSNFSGAYLDKLNSILSNCPHLQLSNSETLFPDRLNEVPLPLLTVNNDQCSAVVALQGAQLLTFRTQASDGIPSKDFLWLSPKAIFKDGKAIRGGIPVCLPWFGPHSSDPAKPQHGFARNRIWSLTEAEAINSGCTQLTWELEYPLLPQDQDDFLFEGHFKSQLIMILRETIELRLNVYNTGTCSFPLSWALHSYHPVSHVASVKVTGLDQCEFLDNTDLENSECYPTQKRRKLQSGDLVFPGEVDRVYVSAPPTQQLISENHKLTITANNCHSAILWNPGETLASSMADVGAQHYHEFVCVERGNTADNALRLSPGEVHRASIHIKADTGS